MAVAAAAPKADPYYLLHPYLVSPHAKTADLVTHPNGAVVPSDTVSVQAARAGHLATKVTNFIVVPFVAINHFKIKLKNRVMLAIILLLYVGTRMALRALSWKT